MYQLIPDLGFVGGSSSGSCLKDKINYDHGEVTAYGTSPTGGHCGFTELPSDQAKKYFVAISSQDPVGWSDGIYCGSCVRLTYTDGKVRIVSWIMCMTYLYKWLGKDCILSYVYGLLI